MRGDIKKQKLWHMPIWYALIDRFQTLNNRRCTELYGGSAKKGAISSYATSKRELTQTYNLFTEQGL